MGWAAVPSPAAQRAAKIKTKDKLQIFPVPFSFQREFQLSPHELKISQLSPDFCFKLVITSSCRLLLLEVCIAKVGVTLQL